MFPPSECPLRVPLRVNCESPARPLFNIQDVQTPNYYPVLNTFCSLRGEGESSIASLSRGHRYFGDFGCGVPKSGQKAPQAPLPSLGTCLPTRAVK